MTGPVSLLWPGEPGVQAFQDQPDQAVVSDLNLGQIVEAVARNREQGELITALLYLQVRDPDAIRYRHEVFRDLEDPGLFQAAAQFAEQMRQVRVHLDQLAKLDSARHREAWFLDAAAIYCDAVRSLAADTRDRKNDLAAITYQVRIKGPRVEVSRYDGEPDYSAEIQKTFERFRQAAVTDYRVNYRPGPA